MKIFIAGLESTYKGVLFAAKPKYILSTYHGINEEILHYKDTSACKGFMLDSGAFSMLNSLKKINIKEYIQSYIDFINHHDINLFFELDIDKIIGFEKVLQYRKQIEEQTGKQCIPVWHRTRGKKEFLRMVKVYDYVAIGGIAIRDIKPSEYKYFNWFIEQAHQNDCKIHGLGFTKQKLLKRYPFDSVDSTTWNRLRFGEICTFKNGQLKYITKKDKRVKHTPQSQLYCLKEYIKFANYLEYQR